MDPKGLAKPVGRETNAERIHYCRMMLVMHGFLSESESARVKTRMVKRDFVPEGLALSGRAKNRDIAHG